MKEPCIRCGKPTIYDPSTPIKLRRYYVEGSDQLCETCFYELYPVAGALGVLFGTGLDQPAGTGLVQQPDKEDYSK